MQLHEGSRSMRERGGGLDRVEASIADARATLGELERARDANQPEAWEAARSRFEGHRERAAAALARGRTRPGVSADAVLALDEALDALEQVVLPARPDGVRRVAAEAELEALRGAACPDDMTRHAWHRQVNARLRAMVEVMPPRDSDLLAGRIARASATDPLGRWLASRLNAAELVQALRDPKRRARFRLG